MAYVRLDKIKATAHLESFVVEGQDLEVGGFVALGDLQADGEAYLATPSGDQTKTLVFHASVPLTYEERTNELDFKLKAGKVGRGYVLESGDIVSPQSEVLNKNDLVAPDATGFVLADETHTAIGRVIAIETDAYAGRLAVIRIS